MRDMFGPFYPPSEEEISQCLKLGTIALDTNVLLNMYRYPKETRDKYLRLLSDLKDRLWVPHYCMLEFYRNRPSVIREQQTLVGKVKGALRAGLDEQLKGIGKLNLRQRHSLMNVEELASELTVIVEKYEKKLDHDAELLNTIYDDSILPQIENLLAGKVGAPYNSQADLDAIYKEGEKRFLHQIPPGYKDAPKGKESEGCFVHAGLKYQRQYGDLLWWKQLLTHANDSQCDHLVVITDDQKEDFWLELSGQLVGVRPELRDEASQNGVSVFNAYRSDRFLEIASQAIGRQVDRETIESVREITSESVPNVRKALRKLATDLVAHKLPNCKVKLKVETVGSYAFTGLDTESKLRIFVEVQFCNDARNLNQALENVPQKVAKILLSQRYSRVKLFFVANGDFNLQPQGILNLMRMADGTKSSGTVYLYRNHGDIETPLLSQEFELPVPSL